MKVIIELDLDELNSTLDAGTFQKFADSLRSRNAERQEIKTEVNAQTKAAKAAKAPAKPEPAPAEEPQAEEAPQEAQNEPESVEAEGGKTYTLELVRATLAMLNKAGKSAAVKALLGEFGAEKLTHVDPANFEALMDKAVTL